MDESTSPPSVGRDLTFEPFTVDFETDEKDTQLSRSSIEGHSESAGARRLSLPLVETHGPSSIATVPPMSAVDEATCRICRSEETPDDRLYHPCKCSGSIKYVHQDCLKQWLAHSKKRHCELCKTPFGFIKIYRSDMPKRVPKRVLFKHAIIQIYRIVLFIIRIVIAVCTWIFIVPWVIRFGWHFLFFVGDFHWTEWFLPRRKIHTAFKHPIIQLAYVLSGTNSTSFISRFTQPSNDTLGVSLVNVTEFMKTVDIGHLPLGITLWNLFLAVLNLPLTPSFARQVPLEDPLEIITPSSEDFSFFGATALNHLTSSARFNQYLVYVVEGWSIVITTVVTFILLFLIREWVIQQQPVADAQGQFDRELIRLGNQPVGAENGVEVIAPVAPNAPLDQVGEIAGSPAETEATQTLTEAQEQPSANMVGPRNRSLSSSSSEGDDQRGSGLRRRGSEVFIPRYGDDLESSIGVPILAENQDDLGLPHSLEGSSEIPIGRPPAFTPVEEMPHYMAWLERQGDVAEGYEALGTDLENSNGHARTQSWYLSRINDLVGRESRGPVRDLISEALDEWTATIESSDEHRLLELAVITRAAEVLHTGESHLIPVEEMSLHDQAVRTLNQWDDHQRRMSFSEALQSAGRPLRPGVVLLNPVQQEIAAIEAPSNIESHTAIIEHIPSLDHPDEAQEELVQNTEASEVDSTHDLVENNTDGGHDEDTDGGIDEGTDGWTDEETEGGTEDGTDDGTNEEMNEDINEEPTINPAVYPIDNPANNPDDDPDWAERIMRFIYKDIIVPDAPQLQDYQADGQQQAGAAVQQNANHPANAAGNAEGEGAVEEEVEVMWAILGLGENFRDNFTYALVTIAVIFLALVVGVFIPFLMGRSVLLMMAKPLDVIWAPVHVYRYFQALATGVIVSLIRLFQLVFPEVTEMAIKGNIHLGPVYSWGKHLLSTAAAQETNLTQTGRLWLSSISQLLRPGYEVSQSQLLSALSVVHQYCPPIVFDSQRYLCIKAGELLQSMDPYTSQARGMRTILLAIFVGYVSFSVLGAVFHRMTRDLNNPNAWLVEFRELLVQGGGIIKVVVIIGIEMMVFPLYCGLLLGLALLPLIPDATVQSRLHFMQECPWTSTFIHWFIGTSYMFHFALFIGMCRKIFRAGVLYFVRDPDDPTFHPVRDVLERPVITQLFRIGYSGILYGTLIAFCVGGVVWSLDWVLPGQLAFRWSVAQPILEYPLEVLFYTFVLPVCFNSIEPAVWLKMVYAWWFKLCARQLRLSHFLFNNRQADEEGAVVPSSQPVHSGVEPEQGNEGSAGSDEGIDSMRQATQVNGRFVRAPNCDRVRIPRGQDAFLAVDSEDRPLDPAHDNVGQISVHARRANLFTKLFLPSFFRTRLTILIIMGWLFTAAFAAIITISPLALGRILVRWMVVDYIPTDDAFALALGIVLLSVVYNVAQFGRYLVQYLHEHGNELLRFGQFVAMIGWLLLRVLRLVFAYTAIFTVGPLCCALALGLYIVVPTQTYLHPEQTVGLPIPQAFTIGVLSTLVGIRMLSNRTDTRPGLAWQRVVARGYWDPDVYILFRCIIGPGIICMTIDFCTPLFAGWLLIQTHTLILGAHYSALEAAHVYHYANPSALLLCFVLDSVPTLVAAAQRWVERVKDSEFQVGEELQNHGEVGLDPGSVVGNGGEPSAGLDTMAHDHDHDALVEAGG